MAPVVPPVSIFPSIPVVQKLQRQLTTSRNLSLYPPGARLSTAARKNPTVRTSWTFGGSCHLSLVGSGPGNLTDPSHEIRQPPDPTRPADWALTGETLLVSKFVASRRGSRSN